MAQTENYANDLTNILLGQGILLENEQDEIKRFVRGW